MIRINEVEITQDQIAREMQYHPAVSSEQAFQAAARALLIQEALRQTCVKEGLCDAPPQDPAQEEAVFEKLLDANIQTPEIDEETCQRYFENHREQFSSSPLVEARHILLGAAEDDKEGREAAYNKAKEIIAQLQNDIQQFTTLANEFSACPSKTQGGNLGQLSRGSTVPEFEKVLFAAPQGLMQEPVNSRYGLHVVEIIHTLPGEPLPFEHAKTKIAAYLQLNARQQATAHYLHRLLAAQQIEGFDWEASLN